MEGKASITEKLTRDDMPESLVPKKEVLDGELIRNLIRLGYYSKVKPDTLEENIVTGILENGNTIQGDTNGVSNIKVMLQLEMEQAKRVIHVKYLFIFLMIIVAFIVGLLIFEETKMYSTLTFYLSLL